MTLWHGGSIVIAVLEEVMSRTTRRRAVRAVAPVAGLLAAGLLVWQGSYAAFSASTNNQSDAWATGNLNLTNNGGTLGAGTYAGTTTALFRGTVAGQPENNLKIGSTGTKCITVESTGSLAGALKMYRGTVSGTNSALLAPQVSLTIDAGVLGAGVNVGNDCVGFPGGPLTNVATGVALSALPTSYVTAVPSVAVGTGTQRVAYRIVWTITTTGNNTTDNGLQNSSAIADLTWEIQ
jgi:hypothetical protein